jgi:hypothetical protein
VEPITVGGTPGAIRAHRLLDASDGTIWRTRRVSDAPFVGREAELGFLQDAFTAAQDERRTRVVFVLAEAGTGKSRLAAEFASSLEGEAQVLLGRCVSYGEGATYLPLTEIVRQIAPERPQATIARLLDRDERGALIAERIAELTGQSEGTAPTGELFWAVRSLFEALARRRPLVVVLEDLHWAEPTFLDLIEYLAAWTIEAPLLLVCLARPELRSERPGLGAEADVVKLEPLTESQAHMLIGGWLDRWSTTRRVGVSSRSQRGIPSSSSNCSPTSMRPEPRLWSRCLPRSARFSQAASTGSSPRNEVCSNEQQSRAASSPAALSFISPRRMSSPVRTVD